MKKENLMKHYETLMLLPVTATPNDLALIEKQLKTLTKAAEGTLGTFDKWGRYKLAYPIRNQEYGCYVLARYELTDVQSFFQKLEHFLKVKCVDVVMRYVHVSLTPVQYAEPYIKPEAMETAGQVRGDYRPRTGFAPNTGEATETVTTAAVVEETVVESVASDEIVNEG